MSLARASHTKLIASRRAARGRSFHMPEKRKITNIKKETSRYPRTQEASFLVTECRLVSLIWEVEK